MASGFTKIKAKLLFVSQKNWQRPAVENWKQICFALQLLVPMQCELLGDNNQEIYHGSQKLREGSLTWNYRDNNNERQISTNIYNGA